MSRVDTSKSCGDNTLWPVNDQFRSMGLREVVLKDPLSAALLIARAQDLCVCGEVSDQDDLDECYRLCKVIEQWSKYKVLKCCVLTSTNQSYMYMCAMVGAFARPCATCQH